MYAATRISNFQDTKLFLLERSSRRMGMPISVTPLPLFIGIIEYGKLRLNSIMQILQNNLRPTSFAFLYSNVDNFIIACFQQQLEDALLDQSPTGREAFLKAWGPIVDNKPGCLKLEWQKGPDICWEFVTPFCMFHVLKTNENQHTILQHRGLSEQHRKDSFDVALSILRQETTLIQMQKRINRLHNSDLHFVTLKY